MRRNIGGCLLELLQGDITAEQVDAIVNAANDRLAGGGGVDGAIHAAGGPEIMAETKRRYPDGCRTGQAVASGAGQLPAKFVFHTVGPVWKGGRQGERALLQDAYRNCLALAVQHSCQSIAFPAISAGVYGYPMDRAAVDALEAVIGFLRQQQSPQRVRFLLFSAGAYGAFSRALQDLVSE